MIPKVEVLSGIPKMPKHVYPEDICTNIGVHAYSKVMPDESVRYWIWDVKANKCLHFADNHKQYRMLIGPYVRRNNAASKSKEVDK